MGELVKMYTKLVSTQLKIILWVFIFQLGNSIELNSKTNKKKRICYNCKLT